MTVSKLEGQPWISTFHLLSKEVFRERYHLNTFRKGQILRLRKYINDVLLDQLPFLKDIMRHMDELQLMAVPDGAPKDNVFMFQEVAKSRDSATRNRDWAGIANFQAENVFTMQVGLYIYICIYIYNLWFCFLYCFGPIENSTTQPKQNKTNPLHNPTFSLLCPRTLKITPNP